MLGFGIYFKVEPTGISDALKFIQRKRGGGYQRLLQVFCSLKQVRREKIKSLVLNMLSLRY